MNMRHILLILFSMILLSKSIDGRDVLLEFKPSYFLPQEKVMRDIYSGGVFYNVETTVQARNNIYAWGSLGYFGKSGRSIGGDDYTKIKIVPIGIGLKYFYTIPYCYCTKTGEICPENLHVYIGAGVTANYLNLKNEYPYVIERHSDWGPGLMAKSGLIVDMTKFLFLDLFIDYSYAWFSYTETMDEKVIRHNVNIGGGYFGLGLGWRF